MASILPDLILLHQVAFLKERKIQDHIALAHELTQKLQKGAKGKGICLKLDIFKAFDKLDWAVLFKVLDFFGFSKDWISLIEECICSSKCSVLVNRELSGYFELGCGLRQGDPLFPYLFILAEEILSLNIENLVDHKQVAPIYRAPTSPSTCHLMYADDILLFFQATHRSINAIQGVLNSYQLAAGQHFNLGKGKILFGNSRQSFKSRISMILGIPQAFSPVKYLGVAHFIGSPKAHFFESLNDSFRRRLVGWKCNMASFVGRAILVKHVLQSLTIHVIHVLLVLPIPNLICTFMEKWIGTSSGLEDLNKQRGVSLVGNLFVSLSQKA